MSCLCAADVLVLINPSKHESAICADQLTSPMVGGWGYTHTDGVEVTVNLVCRYLNSKSDAQLRGAGVATASLHQSCAPQDALNGSSSAPIDPCGLVAWSSFNDTFQVGHLGSGKDPSEAFRRRVPRSGKRAVLKCTHGSHIGLIRPLQRCWESRTPSQAPGTPRWRWDQHGAFC